MGRSRYIITELDKPHFMTCTVMEWLPVFTRPEMVQIILDCWHFQREQQGLKLYGYVILENHLHFIAQAPRFYGEPQPVLLCSIVFYGVSLTPFADPIRHCVYGLLDCAYRA